MGALNWLGDTFRASAVCLPLTPSAYFFPDRERCCRAGGTAWGIIFQYPAPFWCIFSSLSPSVCCPLNTELFCYIDKETLNWQGDTLLFFFLFFCQLFDTSLYGYFLSFLPPPLHPCQVHRAEISVQMFVVVDITVLAAFCSSLPKTNSLGKKKFWLSSQGSDARRYTVVCGAYRSLLWLDLFVAVGQELLEIDWRLQRNLTQ